MGLWVGLWGSRGLIAYLRYDPGICSCLQSSVNPFVSAISTFEDLGPEAEACEYDFMLLRSTKNNLCDLPLRFMALPNTQGEQKNTADVVGYLNPNHTPYAIFGA